MKMQKLYIFFVILKKINIYHVLQINEKNIHECAVNSFTFKKSIKMKELFINERSLWETYSKDGTKNYYLKDL